jgi:hypothetical protein
MIFVASNIIVLSLTSGYHLIMLKCTSDEFIMILSLLEIIIHDLCLFLIINMCSMFHKGYRCVSWFFGIFLDQSMCRRKLGFIYVVFILICIIPLYAN